MRVEFSDENGKLISAGDVASVPDVGEHLELDATDVPYVVKRRRWRFKSAEIVSCFIEVRLVRDDKSRDPV